MSAARKRRFAGGLEAGHQNRTASSTENAATDMPLGDSRWVLRLLRWYEQFRRPLPWRKTKDPYSVWISEIMLQQTQVNTVLPYYRRFLEKFPNVAALAEASLDDVLKIWENLGYYARARNLHESAREIMKRYEGRIPDQWEAIIRLPGIGRYTAGAVLSIAFGQAVPAVDGNVRRVISRLYAIEMSIDDETTRQQIESLVGTLVPQKYPGHFNQALMELGAIRCTVKNPVCRFCPLCGQCLANKRSLTNYLPVRDKKKPVPRRHAVAAVIRNGDGRILIVRRPAHGLLGSLWKFPGGFLNPGEPLEAGLIRTVREELGIGIAVGNQIISVKHAYTHFRITLAAFSCTFQEGTPAGPPWSWAGTAEMADLSFSKADRLIANSLMHL